MQSFYREILLDHFEHPRNRRELEDADIHEHIDNPLCGDVVTVYAKVHDGTFEDVSFTGRGCSISQASASMLTEQLTGKSRDEVEQKYRLSANHPSGYKRKQEADMLKRGNRVELGRSVREEAGAGDGRARICRKTDTTRVPARAARPRPGACQRRAAQGGQPAGATKERSRHLRRLACGPLWGGALGTPGQLHLLR